MRYEYDSIDRLVREDNKKLGLTVLFAYDNCGNIISRRQTSFTLKENVEECDFTETLYSYDGDELLSFGAEMCEYDEIGNPKIYRGKTVAWEKGRQMTAYDGNTFSYDGQGRRISKNSITYTYDGSGRLVASSNGLEYLYDNAGVFAVKHSNATYFYRKDAQGNIIALLDSNGSVVVRYVYDAWGNHAVLGTDGNDISDANHIGILNPFRYRGYFYDEETGLYYLKTRYYDPETGRFITIDGIEYLDPETINGLNLYAYCGNNPVMYTDPNGTAKWWEWLLGIVIIIGAVALSVVTAGLAAPVSAAVGGGLLGAIVGGAVAGAVGGAITGFAFSVASQGIANGFNNINWGQVGEDTLFGALSGAFAGGVFGGIKYVANAGKIASMVTKIGPGEKKFYDFLKHGIKLSNIVKKGLPYMSNPQKNYYIAQLFVDGIYLAGKSLLKSLYNNIIKENVDALFGRAT